MRNTPGQDDAPATDRAIMRGAERILKLYRISPGCILRILSKVQSDPALRDLLSWAPVDEMFPGFNLCPIPAGWGGYADRLQTLASPVSYIPKRSARGVISLDQKRI